MAEPRVLVPLAPGFEEIEAVTIVDVLRRAGVEVVTASLEKGPVRGSHGITLIPDCALDDAVSHSFAMVALPGGLPGAEHLRDHPTVQRVVRDHHQRGAYVTAICAAPMALGAMGLTQGRTATSFPGFGEHLTGAQYREDRVVVDGKLITSRGPGTALEFALTLVEKLKGREVARKLAEGMLVNIPAPAHEVASPR